MQESNGFSVIAVLLVIFCNICIVYFCLAKGYFFFFDPPEKEDTTNKDFYGLTISHNKPIPYEIVNVHERNKLNKMAAGNKKKDEELVRDNDSANNDLVNTIK